MPLDIKMLAYDIAALLSEDYDIDVDSTDVLPHLEALLFAVISIVAGRQNIALMPMKVRDGALIPTKFSRKVDE